MVPRDIKIYLAGYFDGEGCIIVSKSLKKNRGPKGSINPCHWLECSIGSIDPRPFELLLKYYGGSVHKYKKIKKNHQQCYQWRIRCGQAKPFIEDILPYTIIKKEQLEVGLKFLEIFKRERPTILTKEEIEEREFYRQKLKQLKILH